MCFKTNIKVFLLVFAFTNILHSQPVLDQYSGKIHPFFKKLITTSQTNSQMTVKMPLITSVGTNKFGEKIYSATIRIKDEADIYKSDVKINSVIPGFATARLTGSEMQKLAEYDNVSYIYPGEIMYPNNDITTGLIGADLVQNGYINSTNYDGTGVILLFIDSGIDWSHLDFRDPTDPTLSRILYIWDQTETIYSGLSPEDRDGTNFSGLNYGAEYTQTDINNEIDGSPAGYVLERDNNGHGTHVAGIAAGNGSALPSEKYSGIAPNADIVVVKAGEGSFTTENLIDALNYAQKISLTEGKPVVVNMSLGGQANAHDGTRDLDEAVDDFTSSGAGRVVTISAGNAGDGNIHISGSVSTGNYVDLIITVPTYTANAGTGNDYFGFDVWWNNSDNITATVTSPNGYSYTRTINSDGTSYTNDGAIYVFNYIDASHTNGDRRNYFRIDDSDPSKPPASGTWSVRLTNNSSATMTYHGWLFGSSMGATLTSGDNNYTIGSPGVATTAITVGSYASRWRWTSSSGSSYGFSGTDRSDNISSFSSIGPRRDGVQKPEIAAPGEGIISTTSSSYTPDAAYEIVANDYHLNVGTSMSSPAAAGAVALLLDANSTLTAAEVKAYITSNTTTDNFTGGTLPNYTWGFGKLNIFKVVAKAVNASWNVNFDQSIFDTWSGDASNQILANEKIAIRFSPHNNGDITGVFFHPSVTVNISGNLNFEIWTDNGGSPNSKIGSTVSIAASEISRYSWNYLNLTNSMVDVTNGIDYHVVMYYTSGTSMYVRYDSGNNDGRSSINTGSSWSNFISGDWRIRPVVATSADALPVELTTFSAKEIKSKIILNWQTATEVNNYGFEIERQSSEISSQKSEWTTLGFVEGHGNSNSPKVYTFIDDNPIYGTNHYRLKQIDTDGTFEYSDEIEIEVESIIENKLVGNYPNPFNPATIIRFDLARDANVSLTVYNIVGEVVQKLVDKKMTAGKHKVEFDASNLSSGIYFYQLNTGKFIDVKKMMVIK